MNYFREILPANPMNTPNPKQAKNAKNTITNSPLCIEYTLIWTDLKIKHS